MLLRVFLLVVFVGACLCGLCGGVSCLLSVFCLFCLSFSLSVWLSVFVCLFFCMCGCLSMCVSVYFFILSVCLSVILSMWCIFCFIKASEVKKQIFMKTNRKETERRVDK